MIIRKQPNFYKSDGKSLVSIAIGVCFAYKS